MFYYLKGISVHKTENFVVLDNQGVGFKVFTSGATLARITPNQETTLYTYTYVREDALDIFGFYSQEELAFFEKLISVSGVGPRLALAILSTYPAQDLILAILTNDSKKISGAPGVGPKLAQRIILELKDKLKNNELEEAVTYTPAAASYDSEAVSALMVLGYGEGEARRAVSAVGTGFTVEETIKKALNILAG